MASLGVRRHREFDPLIVPKIDHDALFAFLMLMPALFVAQLGSLGAGLFLLGGAVFILPYWRQLGRLLAPRAFLLIPALAALASMLWSDDPGATLRYGLQVLLTVLIGLGLSMAIKPRAVLFGLFAAYAIYVGIAIVFGRFVAAEYHGELAFVGLYGGKNYMGDVASTGAMVSAGVAALALADRAWMRLVIALAAFALEIYVTIIARTAGALISLAAGIGALAALGATIRLPANGRLTVAGLTGAAMLAIGFAFNSLRDTVSDSAAQMFDKDPTLTGRTYLWYRAQDVIAQHPLLGHGYAAFWREGNIDAEGLWRWAGLKTPTGFNFHNSFIELMVQLGIAGMIVVCAVIGLGIVLLARRQLVRPNLITAFWLSMLAFQLVRTPFEGIILIPIDFGTMLMFAALGSAFQSAEPAARRVIRRPRPFEARGPLATTEG